MIGAMFFTAGLLAGAGMAMASIATGLRDAIRDAKRYRWLRNSRNYEIQATSRTLDAAIDTAMALDREG